MEEKKKVKQKIGERYVIAEFIATIRQKNYSYIITIPREIMAKNRRYLGRGRKIHLQIVRY